MTSLDLPPARLEHVFSLEAELGEPLELGTVRGSRRRIIPILGGRVWGPALDGEVMTGSDWQSVDDDSVTTIDTRYSIRADDGALISVATQGYRHGPAEVLARLAAGEPVAPSDYYFRLTAKLDSSAPLYEWMSRTIFVAVAARGRASITYQMQRLI